MRNLNKENSVAVIGFNDGLAGQTAEWFEKTTGLEIAVFIDEGDDLKQFTDESLKQQRKNANFEYPESGSFKNRPFLQSQDWEEKIKDLGIHKILVLTPDNHKRRSIIQTCREKGLELVSAIHPTATILEQASIEPGVWIGAGALIGYKANIQSGVFVNSRATVDHHSILESCCQLDPGVILAGNVVVGQCAHIHAGATVTNRISIGADSIVGAGAVVIQDVPNGVTVMGVPAKPKK